MNQRQRFGGGPLDQTGTALKFQTIEIPKVDDVLEQIDDAKHDEICGCLDAECPKRAKR